MSLRTELVPWETGTHANATVPSERAHCARTAQIYYAWRGRQAWHWTWSEVYFRDIAFSPSKETLRQIIELNRSQGSVWHICTIPALVFAGDSHCLVITEINSQKPLAALTTLTPNGRTLGELATGYAPQQADTVMRLIGSSLRFDHLAPDPLPALKAVPQGQGLVLGWETVPHYTCSGEAIRQLARAYPVPLGS